MHEPLEVHPGRETQLGPLQIWRALPARGRRLIGPWCFLDRYGPLSFSDAKPMDVAPHPHIGIKTVSWLLEGEVLHRDSLGFEAMVRPGGVNIMTSGAGIAHAEETPRNNAGRLNGVQLWLALRDDERHSKPAFTHVPSVPVEELAGGTLQTFYPDDIGAEIRVHPRSTLTLPLDAACEHGLFLFGGDLVLHGQALNGQALGINAVAYLPPGRNSVDLRTTGGATLLLIGGQPFPEPVLMWWNFVARTPEEIAAARKEWEEGTRFGVVRGYDGPRLHAPSLARLAQPNPAS